MTPTRQQVEEALTRSWPIREDNLTLADRVLIMMAARAWVDQDTDEVDA